MTLLYLTKIMSPLLEIKMAIMLIIVSRGVSPLTPRNWVIVRFLNTYLKFEIRFKPAKKKYPDQNRILKNRRFLKKNLP